MLFTCPAKDARVLAKTTSGAIVDASALYLGVYTNIILTTVDMVQIVDIIVLT